MGALSHDRIAVVRALIQTAPDSAVRKLDTALKGDLGDGGLAAVRAMIDAEVWERNVRDAVFAPVIPLCAPRADGFEQVQFPPAVLPRLWRVLKLASPASCALALAEVSVGAEGEGVPPAYDKLCREAAAGLQGGDPAFAPVTEFLDSRRPGAAAQLAGFLAVAPIARSAVQRLPGWIRQMTNDNAAAVRLMYKDAVQISDDGGARLVEVLAAHLREPWTILRVICAVTSKADRYLSSSEMAFFGERILADIDNQLNRIRLFDVDNGPEAGEAAAKALVLAVAAASEFEGALELDKEGVWGKRLGKQKVLLAGIAETYLKKCGKLVGEALPMQSARGGGGSGPSRNEPRLSAAPDEHAVRRAMAGLTFFDKVRLCASLGGYGVVRAKVCEEITQGLDSYLEAILGMVHGKEAPDAEIARAYLEVVAEFMGLTQDQKAAQIVRRRAAAV